MSVRHSAIIRPTYVVEQLSEFAESLLNAFDVFMTLLHFSVCSARLSISVGTQELKLLISNERQVNMIRDLLPD